MGESVCLEESMLVCLVYFTSLEEGKGEERKREKQSGVRGEKTFEYVEDPLITARERPGILHCDIVSVTTVLNSGVNSPSRVYLPLFGILAVVRGGMKGRAM